jgi:hypothetical protein
MTRKIKKVSIVFNDDKVNEADSLIDCVELSVITRCPEKYLLIDKETGAVYAGSSDPNPYMSGYCLWKEIR